MCHIVLQQNVVVGRWRLIVTTVYVAPDGSLSYTQAHSAYIPDGSILDGWSRTESESFGHLIFRDGLIACPTGEDEKGWQVFGNIAGVQFDPACLGFNAVTGELLSASAVNRV
ncbi:uncharacterized protein EI97DRAFT_434727 [Westerdykella ornata]|uniref:Uncharacterized protein n=1 Tax=Westerdykella ornata TaxID=318751 RepID=A0A6A6JEH8_WESOR|nr:uncharacterized protein EI97DRAFT_434727 [Westerdykella ornata]KAF2274822.1 hypothetical protein EI97DRAFT_434727 [Westerdykella ornata]